MVVRDLRVLTLEHAVESRRCGVDAQQPECGVNEVLDLAGEIVDCSRAVLGDLAGNAFESLDLDRDLAQLFDQSCETSRRGVSSRVSTGVSVCDCLQLVEPIELG